MASEHDFSQDLSGIHTIRVPDTPWTAFLNFKRGRSKLKRVASAVLRLLFFPDHFRYTVDLMNRAAREHICKTGGFDLIISSALPFSTHLAAVSLRRDFGIPVILDNRDYWACSAYRRRLPLSSVFERFYERKILEKADFITTISDTMTNEYLQHYPELKGRIKTIRNGYDSNPIHDNNNLEKSTQDTISVVYTGILYGATRKISPALRALQAVHRKVKVDFYGSEADQVSRYQTEFENLDIINHGRVSRDEALAAQRSADIVLLALGTDAIERTFLPGKFFEYVASGRPIIAVADEDSEIGNLIEKYGLGVASRSEKEIKNFLEALIAGRWKKAYCNVDELSRKSQLEKLEALAVQLNVTR
jgi:glycosyltransferase involved in cell wall biosynthesis